MKTNFTDRIEIIVTPKEGSNDLEAVQDCWLITNAIFLVIAKASHTDSETTWANDNTMTEGYALSEVALLGAVFSNVAWNIIDKYLVGKQGGKNA